MGNTSSGQPDKGDFSKATCRLRSLDFLAASRFFLLLPCIILSGLPIAFPFGSKKMIIPANPNKSIYAVLIQQGRRE